MFVCEKAEFKINYNDFTPFHHCSGHAILEY